MAMCPAVADAGGSCGWNERRERGRGRAVGVAARLGVVNSSGVGNYCVDGNSP